MLEDSKIPSGAQGKILAVTNDSPYRTNDFIVNPRRFELGRYAAIALSLEVDDRTTEAPPASTPSTTTAGSAATIASFFTVMISLALSFLN